MIHKNILNVDELVTLVEFLLKLPSSVKQVLDYLPDDLRSTVLLILNKWRREKIIEQGDVDVLEKVGNYLRKLGFEIKNEKLVEIGNQILGLCIILRGFVLAQRLWNLQSVNE